jgi:transposase
VGVIIGMDPHKRSATIEVIDDRGGVLVRARFGTDQVGYKEMLAAGREFAGRVWAVEGCNGIGKHIAHRLVHDGETVLDVPPKLSAQVRVFATGNGRKTDPVDAHSVAMVALRTPSLNRVEVDDDLVVLGMLADRRDELGRARTQTVNRLHRLLLELFPGGAKQFLSAQQARALIATIKPRDLPGKTRRRLAVELIGELEAIDRKIKTIKKELTALITARGSTLLELNGIGPSCAARLLADVGDIHRFADRDRFASWNGTAPLDASSGKPATTPPVPRRQPTHQPGTAHDGGRPTPKPDRGTRLLRQPQGRRHALDDGDARAETATVQRRVRPHARRPTTTRGGGPGWAIGDDSAIQRGRPNPGHRLFGQATSRTRQAQP